MSNKEATNVELKALIDINQKQASELRSLKSGGGGGTFDGMEARVSKLESLAEDTRSTLESIQRQLARIDTKLDGKPDQGWIITLIIAVFGLSFAVIAATAGIFALIK
ncbi:hypothetical protein [Brucella sp. JSBI001]|uniref:hypothetical protein n=1 Tax=Brucella sp. JSBI001 TaxID=2886044 RepID=UPI00222E346B|nr:hypothetical protein [Brucella sp. JSBI001]UZD70894.1 hypothetical protein LJ361_05610 [Brucella sp. JSBI001]